MRKAVLGELRRDQAFVARASRRAGYVLEPPRSSRGEVKVQFVDASQPSLVRAALVVETV